MSPELWMTFILASMPVHLAPGPNNILALSHAIRHGYCTAHLGSLGRYPSYLMIFLAAGFGLGALLSASPAAFAVLKWIGALYLVWIGYRLLRSTGTIGAIIQGKPTMPVALMAMVRSEFLIAIMNPKAIIFATAFYAQFITPGQVGFAQLFTQMVVVSLTLEGVAAGCYAVFGATIGGAVQGSGLLAWITRGLGAVMIGFGMLLVAS